MLKNILFMTLLIIVTITFVVATATQITTASAIVIVFSIAFATMIFIVAQSDNSFSEFSAGSIAFIVALFLGGIVVEILGSGFFTADKRIAVANVSEIAFSAEKSVEEAQVVDAIMASALAKTALGKKINGVSVSTQFQLDTDHATLQSVKGDLVWVFPLMHHSMVKAMQAPTVPGYVMVSATKGHVPAKVIEAEYQITSSGWFGKNLDRVGWSLSGASLKHSHFEVDDNLKPYWIISAFSNKGFTAAPSVNEVFVVDAQSGKAVSGTPAKIVNSIKWLDEVIPLDIATQRASDVGSFEGEWFNQSIFGSGEGVSVLTKYPEPAFLKGKKYYIASMTSVSGADNSSTGLILVDAKTGVSIKVDIMGMSEDGAINAANAALGAESTRWAGTNAQPVIIKGQWYWAVSIAATQSGLYQKAALVKMDDASIVVFGDNMVEAANALENKKQAAKSATGKMTPKQKLIQIKDKMADLQKELDAVLAEMN